MAADRDPFPVSEPASPRRKPQAEGLLTPADKLPGKQLGPYRLLAQIGRGGMGVVYRAEHVHLGRPVAIKLMRPDSLGDSDSLRRFYAEMKALGKVDHPNVVRPTDAGSFDGTHFLAMEFAEGASLNLVLKQAGTLTVADACEMVRQALEGLVAIDQLGLIHRDLKPSNLMLTPQGTVKILDLGLARFTHSPHSNLTTPGQILGTFDYMSPEQASGGACDIRCDIYSLGCTLYALLTGEPPFASEKFSLPHLKLKAHVEEEFPSLLDKRTDLPRELAAVLDRMVAKLPGDRYATPSAARDAIAPFCRDANLEELGQSVIRQVPDSPVWDEDFLNSQTDNLAGTTASMAAEETPLASPSTVGIEPRRAVALLGGVGLFGLVVFALAWSTGRFDKRQPIDAAMNSLLSPVETAPPSFPSPTPSDAEPPTAVASLPRILDQADPLSWHDLLTSEPRPALWEVDIRNDWNFTPAREQLDVHNIGFGLLELGEIKVPNYTLQVSLSQTPWTGGCGLYLGSRDDVPADTGKPRIRAQVIYLKSYPQPDRTTNYRIVRSELTSVRGSNGTWDTSSSATPERRLPCRGENRFWKLKLPTARCGTFAWAGSSCPILSKTVFSPSSCRKTTSAASASSAAAVTVCFVMPGS